MSFVFWSMEGSSGWRAMQLLSVNQIGSVFNGMDFVTDVTERVEAEMARLSLESQTTGISENGSHRNSLAVA